MSYELGFPFRYDAKVLQSQVYLVLEADKILVAKYASFADFGDFKAASDFLPISAISSLEKKFASCASQMDDQNRKQIAKNVTACILYYVIPYSSVSNLQFSGEFYL
jgi:hypothetical protein